MEFNLVEIVNNILVLIGVPLLLASAIHVGKKLQVLDKVQSDLEKVKSNLKVVTDFLVDYDDFDHTEIQSYSPLTLTDKGTELIADFGFEKILEEHQVHFFDYINQQNPKQKHDVELAALASVYFLKDEEYMSFLKTFLYNNPERTLQNLAPTLGIFIRDKYLAEHPEIEE